MSGGRAHHESAQPASARSPFSERVVEKLDSFRGLFRASVSGAQTAGSAHGQQTAAHEAALHRHSVPSSLPSSELRRIARDIHAAKEGSGDTVSSSSAPLSRVSTGDRSFFGVHGAKYSHGPLNQMRGAVRNSSEHGPGEDDAGHQSWWPLGSSQDRRRSIAVDGTEVSDGDRRGGHGLGISAVSPRDDGDDDGLAGSPRTKDLDTFAQAFLVQNNID